MSDCSHTGVEQIPKKKSAQKVKWGEDFLFFFRYEKSDTPWSSVHLHRIRYEGTDSRKGGKKEGLSTSGVYLHGCIKGRYLFTWKCKGKVFVYMEV